MANGVSFAELKVRAANMVSESQNIGYLIPHIIEILDETIAYLEPTVEGTDNAISSVTCLVQAKDELGKAEDLAHDLVEACKQVEDGIRK